MHLCKVEDHYRNNAIEPRNVASKPTNLVYPPRLTNEETEEYNTDEYMTLYSSVPRNIKLYSSIMYNR
jgi:hypothetical protein